MEKINLAVRETFKFSTAYSDLDEWRDIGTAALLASSTEEADEHGIVRSFCLYYVTADGATTGDIGRALEDAHEHGCGCEHDCCGHFFGGGEAEHIDGNYWIVRVHSSRNY